MNILPKSNAELRELAWSTLMPGFPGVSVPSWAKRCFEAGLTSVCLYGDNVSTSDQLRQFVAQIRLVSPGALIAVDEEGGDVTRIHYREGSPYPGNAVLGRIDDLHVTRNVGAQVGQALTSLGINLDLAPDIDVNSNPNNPVIGTRSFGSDPRQVADHGVAWSEGLQSQGVGACVKHYPGHGDTADDSHLSLPTIDASLNMLRERELVPFAAAAKAGIAAIMSSHIVVKSVDPEVPATYSKSLLRDILRGDLGFTGVVISDALDMEGARVEGGIPAGAVKALKAGCDLLCLGTDSSFELLEACVDAIERAVLDGDLLLEDLQASAGRIFAMRERFKLPTKAEPNASSLPTSGQIQSAFSGSKAAAKWFHENPDFEVLRVESPASLAVGQVPWGPFAAATAEPEKGGPFIDSRTTTPGQLPSKPPTAKPLLIVGRLLHLEPKVTEAIRRWQKRGASILVVEMGWPSSSGDDIRALNTYGASRGVGRALLDFISNACGR